MCEWRTLRTTSLLGALFTCCWIFVSQPYVTVTATARSNQYTENQGSRYPASYQNPYDAENQQPQQQNGGLGNRWQQPDQQGGNYRNRQYNRDSYNQDQNQQSQNRRTGIVKSNASFVDRTRHKCKYWVPSEAVEKYPYATKVQIDQANQQQLIEICCPGFGPVRLRGTTLCRPVCENCLNGLCVAPGSCQCYEEFVRSDNGDCVFTCPLGCLNGRCYLDGSCQCDPGYKLDESRKFCRPICTIECSQNAQLNCTEPEVCSCSKGYQLRETGCQPLCTPDCGVGGQCGEDHKCICKPEYTEKDGVCQADCYQKCDNGICYSRNRCICNPGFVYHERSTQCIPI